MTWKTSILQKKEGYPEKKWVKEPRHPDIVFAEKSYLHRSARPVHPPILASHVWFRLLSVPPTEGGVSEITYFLGEPLHEWAFAAPRSLSRMEGIHKRCIS